MTEFDRKLESRLESLSKRGWKSPPPSPRLAVLNHVKAVSILWRTANESRLESLSKRSWKSPPSPPDWPYSIMSKLCPFSGELQTPSQYKLQLSDGVWSVGRYLIWISDYCGVLVCWKSWNFVKPQIVETGEVFGITVPNLVS